MNVFAWSSKASLSLDSCQGFSTCESHFGRLLSTWRSQVASGLSGMCWPHIWIQFHLTRRGCSKDSSDVTLVKPPCHPVESLMSSHYFCSSLLGQVIETSWITSKWTVTDSHSAATHHVKLKTAIKEIFGCWKPHTVQWLAAMEQYETDPLPSRICSVWKLSTKTTKKNSMRYNALW